MGRAEELVKKGDGLVASAQSKMGFFSFLSGGSSEKYEDAVEAYTQAANLYRVDEQYQQAAAVLEKAAVLQDEKLDQKSDAANTWSDASKTLVSIDPENAVRMQRLAVDRYVTNIGLSRAANPQRVLAEMVENEIQGGKVKAIDEYSKAYKFNLMMTTSNNMTSTGLLTKTADLTALTATDVDGWAWRIEEMQATEAMVTKLRTQNRKDISEEDVRVADTWTTHKTAFGISKGMIALNYNNAIDMYKKVATNQLKHGFKSTGIHKALEALFKAGLCRLCYQAITKDVAATTREIVGNAEQNIAPEFQYICDQFTKDANCLLLPKMADQLPLGRGDKASFRSIMDEHNRTHVIRDNVMDELIQRIFASLPDPPPSQAFAEADHPAPPNQHSQSGIYDSSEPQDRFVNGGTQNMSADIDEDEDEFA